MANEDMEIFAKFSARGYENPKLMDLALNHPSAYRVWTWAIMYSVRNLTDGFIAEPVAKVTLAARKKDLETLEQSRFFERVDGGWMVHDFLKAQGRSRADVEKDKAEMSEKRRKAAEARWAKQPTPDATPMHDAMQEQCTPDASAMQVQCTDACKPDAKSCTDTDIDNRLQITDSYTPPTPSRPDFDGIVKRIGEFYPPHRWDGASSRVRFDLEAQWPKVVRTAGNVPDVADWFVNRTRAYVDSTEAQYVKKFSGYLGAEYYATPWEKPKPKPVEPVSKQMQNRQHNWQVAVSLMTDEEKRKYGVPAGMEQS